MGTADVRNALHAMDDDAVRRQLAQGDLAPLGDADLSPEEQAMVVAAAEDFPEVAGFSFKQYTSGWNIEQGENWKIEQGENWKIEQGSAITAGTKTGPGFKNAVDYGFKF